MSQTPTYVRIFWLLQDHLQLAVPDDGSDLVPVQPQAVEVVFQLVIVVVEHISATEDVIGRAPSYRSSSEIENNTFQVSFIDKIFSILLLLSSLHSPFAWLHKTEWLHSGELNNKGLTTGGQGCKTNITNGVVVVHHDDRGCFKITFRNGGTVETGLIFFLSILRQGCPDQDWRHWRRCWPRPWPAWHPWDAPVSSS